MTRIASSPPSIPQDEHKKDRVNVKQGTAPLQPWR